MNQDNIKRTERGWAAHFICADRCMFHRNTLIEYDNISIVVSTVGNMKTFYDSKDNKIQMIGADRYFETLVFHSKKNKFNDANVSRQITMNSDWQISEPWKELEADEMHENNINEIIQRLLDGDKFIVDGINDEYK
jgi:hypothetical protein